MFKKESAIIVYVLFCLIFLISGCSSENEWDSKPIVNEVNNEFYKIRVDPIKENKEIKGFNLIVKNNKSEKIEVLLDKTFYLLEGKESGGFIISDNNSGLVDLGSNKLIVPADSTVSAKLFPKNKVEFNANWYNKPLSSGNNSVYLTMKIDNKGFLEIFSMLVWKVDENNTEDVEAEVIASTAL